MDDKTLQEIKGYLLRVGDNKYDQVVTAAILAAKVPQLIAEVERLKAENQELKALLKKEDKPVYIEHGKGTAE